MAKEDSSEWVEPYTVRHFYGELPDEDKATLASLAQLSVGEQVLLGRLHGGEDYDAIAADSPYERTTVQRLDDQTQDKLRGAILDDPDLLRQYGEAEREQELVHIADRRLGMAAAIGRLGIDGDEQTYLFAHYVHGHSRKAASDASNGAIVRELPFDLQRYVQGGRYADGPKRKEQHDKHLGRTPGPDQLAEMLAHLPNDYAVREACMQSLADLVRQAGIEVEDDVLGATIQRVLEGSDNDTLAEIWDFRTGRSVGRKTSNLVTNMIKAFNRLPAAEQTQLIPEPPSED